MDIAGLLDQLSIKYINKKQSTSIYQCLLAAVWLDGISHSLARSDEVRSYSAYRNDSPYPCSAGETTPAELCYLIEEYRWRNSRIFFGH